MPTSAVLIDIDGTLCPRSSGSYLASHIGHARRLTELEDAYAAGHISNAEVCAGDAAAWAGFSVTVVDRWLEDLPVLSGTAGLARWSQSSAVPIILASVAWRPVSEALHRRFGFEVSGGPQLVVTEGRYTGDVEQHFDEYAKRDHALRSAAEHGVSPARCIAVGDGRSDLPLFAAVGTSIAINAAPAPRHCATHVLDTTSANDLIRLLNDLI